LRQIAREFLSSKEAVRKGLMDFGIPLREKGKAHGHESQLRFGLKRKNGNVIVEVQHEQRVIRVARDLHDKDLSLREIAKTLSTMGIPTKCNGARWHPQMVSRILDLKAI
jgi:hypothetical protein